MDGSQPPDPPRGAGPPAPSKQKWLGEAPTFRYPELHRGAGGASGEPASSLQPAASPGPQSESTTVQMSAAMGFSRLGGEGKGRGMSRQSSHEDGPSSSESETGTGASWGGYPDSPLNSPPPEARGDQGDKDGAGGNEEGDLDDLEMDGDLDTRIRSGKMIWRMRKERKSWVAQTRRMGLMNFELHDVPEASEYG